MGIAQSFLSTKATSNSSSDNSNLATVSNAPEAVKLHDIPTQPKKRTSPNVPGAWVDPDNTYTPMNPKTSKKRSASESDPDAEASPSKKSTKPAPPTSPSAASRPSRNRKAPARFTDEQQKGTDKKKAAPKTSTSRVFDPIFITTNANSRLVRADIYHMLVETAAWTSLTVENQRALIDMLPPTSENLGLLAQFIDGAQGVTRPKQLQAGEIFRTDVARFQAELADGHFGKGWQAAAEQAMIDRADGLFDAWKEAEMEAWWGQKMN